MDRLRLTTAGGAIAALAAEATSSCCALPMALVFMGLGAGAVGLLGPLHAFRPLILLAAGGLPAAAWLMEIRRRARGAYPVLFAGSALLAASFFWQTWDPMLQGLALGLARP